MHGPSVIVAVPVVICACAVCKISDCGHCYINLHRLTVTTATNVTPLQGEREEGQPKGEG